MLFMLETLARGQRPRDGEEGRARERKRWVEGEGSGGRWKSQGERPTDMETDRACEGEAGRELEERDE